jgi:phosphatidylinositol alpha-1,6-mannosyltransferase
LRILTIAHSYPLYPGDTTAPFMGSIVEALSARGHSVDVLVPRHPGFRQVDGAGIRYFQYRYSPLAGWPAWGYGRALTGDSRVSAQTALALPAVLLSLRRRVGSLVAAERYDVVHAHWMLPNGWAAAGPAESHRVPLVITLHGSDVAIAERVGLLRGFTRKALTSAAAVTAVSEDLRERVERLGSDPGITRTIHLGVDTEAFAPHEVDPSIRARLGAPVDDLLVVTIGRLVEKKGFRYLISAASQLDGVHVAIVGDGDLRTELESLARSSGASVTFTGNLERAEVREALAAADVVAIPSVIDSSGNVDGLPTTLLEALATGCAVVASAIAGIPEVLTNDENGLLVEAADVDALTRALAELRDQPRLRERLGGEARRRALAELGWDGTARAFEEVYADAEARNRAPR